MHLCPEFPREEVRVVGLVVAGALGEASVEHLQPLIGVARCKGADDARVETAREVTTEWNIGTQLNSHAVVENLPHESATSSSSSMSMLVLGVQ